MIQGKSATQSEPKDEIPTFTNVINPMDFKWTSIMNFQSPEQDKINFDPNYVHPNK